MTWRVVAPLLSSGGKGKNDAPPRYFAGIYDGNELEAGAWGATPVEARRRANAACQAIIASDAEAAKEASS